MRVRAKGWASAAAITGLRLLGPSADWLVGAGLTELIFLDRRIFEESPKGLKYGVAWVDVPPP